MGSTDSVDSSSFSSAGEWLFALVFWIAGLLIIALATGWMPPAPGKLHAPRWVLGAAGVLFFSGGFAPFAARLGPGSWPSRIASTGVLLPLAVIFNWVAFGPGTRHFSGGLSIGGIATSSGPPSQSGGRLAFGIAAILLDVVVCAAAARGLRALYRRT